MTTQQAYEAIRAYFSKPGAEFGYSLSEGTCEYITAEGNKCAVGCLIPDKILAEHGDALNETGSLRSFSKGSVDAPEFVPFEDVPELKELLNGKDKEGQRKFRFLEEAQKAHDTLAQAQAKVELFVARLDGLAQGFGLLV